MAKDFEVMQWGLKLIGVLIVIDFGGGLMT